MNAEKACQNNIRLSFTVGASRGSTEEEEEEEDFVGDAGAYYKILDIYKQIYQLQTFLLGEWNEVDDSEF